MALSCMLGWLAPRRRCVGKRFVLILCWLFVGTVDGRCFAERGFGVGIFLQIEECKSQAVCVARVANIIGFEQRRRSLEILNGLRVVLFLHVHLAESAERQPFLQRGLLFPLIFADIFRTRS